MATVKLTKGGLKVEKDRLKIFQRYLPTLLLKKQQLQAEIRAAEHELVEVQVAYDKISTGFARWIGVFGEKIDLGEPFFSLKEVHIDKSNIAGVCVPVYKGAQFNFSSYDIFLAPIWVDKAADCMQKAMEYTIRVQVAQRKVDLLRNELTLTTQRVNLFEKVKVPECKQNIKRIGVFLGDTQTAEVVRGKISKKKLKMSGG